MIPLQFVLFWAGAKLSYLRFLTFKSLRHFHPEAKISLYISHEFNKKANKWGVESQDFQKESEGKDYIEELGKIDVDVQNLRYVGDPSFCPVFQADIFRWLWMRDNGGFYLDTDQIILKSFETLPLEKEFIYCRYNEVQCGDYFPIGVLGLEKRSKIGDIILNQSITSYNPFNYNSSGPFMMRIAIRQVDLSRSFNAPFMYFYPVNSSINVDRIYSGRIILTDESYALHWYGGSPTSQEFNKNYTEELAKKSRDTISEFCRSNGII